MKKVYENISDMLIPGIIFIFIMAILTGATLFSKLGERMQEETESFSDCADTKETEKICNRTEPQIAYAGRKIWNTGEVISIKDTFPAKDAEGNPLDVEVREITDVEGNDVTDSYRATEHTAVFSHRGIYTFRIHTMDRERKTAAKKFSLVVDGR